MALYSQYGPTGPQSTRRPDQFGMDPQQALAGLQGALQQSGSPSTSIPQTNTPAEASQILQSGAMQSNASAQNQGMLGGYGSMGELRRAANLSDGATYGSYNPGTDSGGFGFARAPGAQNYAQGVLNSINQGAANYQRQNQVIADQAFERQFTSPHQDWQSKQNANRAQDATRARLNMQQEPGMERGLNAEADRSPAAITARGALEAAMLAAASREREAEIAAMGRSGGGGGADEFTKGVLNNIQEINKQLAEQDWSDRELERQNLLNVRSILMQSMALAPEAGPGAALEGVMNKALGPPTPAPTQDPRFKTNPNIYRGPQAPQMPQIQDTTSDPAFQMLQRLIQQSQSGVR